jgi:hypothetical protein
MRPLVLTLNVTGPNGELAKYGNQERGYANAGMQECRRMRECRSALRSLEL